MKLMKNKKGQAIFVGIMVFVMAFIVLVQFIDPIKDQIALARTAENLDCTNTSISFGDRSTCVLVDTALFYYFGMGLAAAAAFLGARFLGQRAS